MDEKLEKPVPAPRRHASLRPHVSQHPSVSLNDSNSISTNQLCSKDPTEMTSNSNSVIKKAIKERPPPVPQKPQRFQNSSSNSSDSLRSSVSSLKNDAILNLNLDEERYSKSFDSNLFHRSTRKISPISQLQTPLGPISTSQMNALTMWGEPAEDSNSRIKGFVEKQNISPALSAEKGEQSEFLIETVEVENIANSSRNNLVTEPEVSPKLFDLIDLNDYAVVENIRQPEKFQPFHSGENTFDKDDSTNHHDSFSKDIEIGPGGGIWNPGYIGLDEYRKLTTTTNSNRTSLENELNNLYDLRASKISKSCSAESDAKDDQSYRSSSEDKALIDGDDSMDNVVVAEAISFSGWMNVIINNKERGKLWAILKAEQLNFYKNDDEVMEPSLGPFGVRNFTFVGVAPENDRVLNIYVKEDTLSLSWIHIKLIVEDFIEHWIFLLAKSFIPKHNTLQYSLRRLNVGGRVWIRQGTTCAWARGWMHLDNRKLYYVMSNCLMLFELDTRKLLSMKCEVAKVDWCASVVGSQKGPFFLLQEGGSFYVQAECDAVTLLWTQALAAELNRTGTELEDQKLTGDDIPVIVDKCIRFISTYGLLQKGLYRRNGSTLEARLLLEELRKDPAGVHITSGSDDMVNIVADVLRSFFRQLDSPLFPNFVQERLFAVAEIKERSRIDEYYEVLNGLTRIRRQTIKRMLDHLKDVSEHSHSNLATVENVAKIFGPTLFSVDYDTSERPSESYGKAARQMIVLKDLILNYATIFRVPLREMHVKSKMDLFFGKANATKARAEGFLVPIHLLERDNHTFNVQSSWTAMQVCEAARSRPSLINQSTSNYALFEIIKGGQLERQVENQEKLNSMVTGRWLDWDPTDCYLVFKRDILLLSMEGYPFADGVKLAEPGSKSFSTSHLKLDSSKDIIHYNKVMKQINQWHIDDLLWYVGHESTRKPPFPYTLTFVPYRKNFKYKSKFIGYCLAFKDNKYRMQWLNAIINSSNLKGQ